MSDLLFIEKVPEYDRAAFSAKVVSVAAQLGIDPNWLMAVMELESAGTFNPGITNSIGATGLIQFMPATALGMGTTTSALSKMTRVQQMDWVKIYYWPYRKKLHRYADLYIATLWPAGLGKPLTYVLENSKISAAAIAKANPLFDLNKDGKITIAEIETKLLMRLPREWANRFKKKSPG